MSIQLGYAMLQHWGAILKSLLLDCQSARAQVRDAFMALDKDNRGTITIRDLKTLLEDCARSESLLKAKFLIDHEARSEHCPHWTCFKDHPYNLFESSSVSLAQENFHLPEEDQQHVFNAFSDSDHAEEDDEIQYSEFLAAMMASRIALHDELLKDAFRRGKPFSIFYKA